MVREELSSTSYLKMKTELIGLASAGVNWHSSCGFSELWCLESAAQRECWLWRVSAGELAVCLHVQRAAALRICVRAVSE